MKSKKRVVAHEPAKPVKKPAVAKKPAKRRRIVRRKVVTPLVRLFTIAGHVGLGHHKMTPTGIEKMGSNSIPGVEIGLSVPTLGPCVSGSDGSYLTPPLKPGTYVLTPKFEGWAFTPLSCVIVVDEQVVNVNFTGKRVLQ
jgi:hypothetical protein